MIKSYLVLHYLKLFFILKYFIYLNKKAKECEIDEMYNGYNILKSITDPMGSVTEYIYYPESSPSGDGIQPVFGRNTNSTIGGYLQSIVIDKDGDRISQNFQYDQLGNITKKTDGEGVLTTYGYNNPFGEVSTLIQGASQSEDGQPQINLFTTFDYDKNGNLKEQKSKGITTEYEYDRLNRLRFKRYKGGSGEGEIVQEYEYKYDNKSNLKEVIYPRGNKNIYTYDHRDLLQDKSAGNGLTTESYTYTSNGNIHTFTDGENKVYTYVHDSQGRLKDIVDPLGNKVSYGYDENSNLTTLDAFNSNGPSLNLSYVYDPLNRLTHQKIQKESGFITTQCGYNDAGYLNSITTPNLHPWEITPTGSGLTDTVTDPIGNIDTQTYDKRGWLRKVAETDAGPDGKELTNNITNNVLGNPVLTGDSVGRDYNYIYHHQKQVLSTVKDPEGGVLSYEYDPLGRLWKVIRHETYNGENKEYTTTYTYDPNNNLKTVTDAKENVTTYDYDSKDRLWKVTYPGNITEWVTYNGNDQIKTYTDMNGTVVTNAYDNAGRLKRRDVTPASGIEGTTYESFKYDGLGRVISASNNDSTVDFIYDKAGRIEKEIHKFKDSSEEGEVIIAAYEVQKKYDDNGNVVQLIYPSGKIVDITPDSLDRISTIKSSNQLIASYQYEGKGKVVERNFKNKIKVETQYEEGRRPETTTHKTIPEENIIFEKTTKWNKLNLKTSEDSKEEKKTYEYDDAQRLRKETAKDTETDELKNETEFTIDGIENIETKKETIKEVTESTTYEYNIRHQLTKVNDIPLTYDNNGNLTKYKHEYVYDWKNRLKKVITGEGINIEYFYDVFGRRIKKVTTAPDGSVIRYFVYSNWQVIEESDESGDIKSRYSYGNKIDERVEIEKSNSPLVSYIPMCDSLGTVMGLADSNGEVVEKIKYSTYGAPIFIYDNTAPEVDVVRTESGNIVTRFSKSINKDNAGNAIKIKQGTTEISGNLTYSDEDMLVTFTPSNALPQDETLTVTITTNLEDTFKNKLAVEFSRDFIYQGADLVIFDRQAPIIEDVIKKSGKFTVTFNEEIDISSITDSIDLTSSQETFSGTITMDDTKSLTFSPSEALSNGVEYTLNVKTIIRDLSGKNLANVFLQVFVNTTQDQILREKPKSSEHNESRIGNTYLFHGRTFDPVTGLYYYRARYLHPELGRFLQIDPMGYEDSLNLYQAFNQNPVNFVDPFGEDVLGACAKSYEHLLRPTENRDIIKAQTRAYKLVSEGISNAAIQTLLIPAKYLTLPFRLAIGFDFNIGVNYTEDRSILQFNFGKQKRLDIVKEQTVVFPLMESFDQIREDIKSGNLDNIFRTGGSLYFNALFWSKVGSLINNKIRGQANRIPMERQLQMLKDDVGYNISPEGWFKMYSEIGKEGTFLTDYTAIQKILGPVSSNTKFQIGFFSGPSKVSYYKAFKLSINLGLKRNSLLKGFRLTIVRGIREMHPRSPLRGNKYFLGPGKGLPSGGPELVVDSIRVKDYKY